MKTLSQIQQQSLGIWSAMYRAKKAGHRDLLNQLGNWASELAEQESLARGSKSPEAMRKAREASILRTPGKVLDHAVALD